MSNCSKALKILKTADQFHFNLREIDDRYSELVYEKFIDLLDPNRMYLDQKDVEVLEKYRFLLDEDVRDGGCILIETAGKILYKKLTATEKLLLSLLDDNSNYHHSQYLEISSEMPFLSPEKLRLLWKDIIRVKTMSLFLDTYEAEDISIDNFNNKYSHLREDVLGNEVCMIQTKLNFPGGIEEFVGSIFLKAITFGFDQHSVYFNSEEQSVFARSLGMESESFGFDLITKDNGEIQINQILPGSPAWNSNVLNEGDIILEAKNEEGVLYKFGCMTTLKAIKFLAEESLTEVTFRIRKKDKSEVDVTLKKEPVRVEENSITSYILTGEKKIGYIYLPSFYSGSNDFYTDVEGCATDIATELIRLKRENIDGLILDIRNNGGGSMGEALELAGIFIDHGAVGIMNSRGEEPMTIRDMNRGAVYSDPLVVLQNHFSASASELFAAAMQDLNRAVIIGSRSFGKSTAQQVLPIDAYLYKDTANPQLDENGFVKLTTGAFYRVTGKTLQGIGVQPDIVLPDLYDGLALSEKQSPSSLEISNIDKNTYYSPYGRLPITELQVNSSIRLHADNTFSTIQNIITELSDQSDLQTIPLNFEAFLAYENSFKIGSNEKTVDASTTTDPGYLISYPSYYLELQEFTPTDAEFQNVGLQKMLTDVYIKESFQIINELIDISKN